ncbi:hypothetical protein J2785_007061 [Burkholderia ambifaria]|nr:hypothetical protein [Burkholderia ambifaria]
MQSKVRTARLLNRAICVGCGCDDFNACWDDGHDSPCFWLRVDYPAGLGGQRLSRARGRLGCR